MAKLDEVYAGPLTVSPEILQEFMIELHRSNVPLGDGRLLDTMLSSITQLLRGHPNLMHRNVRGV